MRISKTTERIAGSAPGTPESEYADAYFQTRFVFDGRRDVVWQEVCRYLQSRHIPPDSRILDVGAGYCSFINHVRGRERQALDLFTRLSDYAADDVITHVQSCTSMDLFEDDHFDVAFTSNVFEHLSRSDLKSTLRELRRVVRPGGLLIVLQPNFRFCYNTYFDDYTHLQIFTDRSLVDLLAVFGFEAREVKARFLPVNMKSTLRLKMPMLRQLVRLYLRLPFKVLAGQMLMVCENRKPTAGSGDASER